MVMRICLVGGIAAGFQPVFAQEFMSHPSGREILTVSNGFNYLGLRLHPSPIAEAQVLSVTSGSAVVEVGVDVVSLLVSGTPFIFEVDSGSAVGSVVKIDAFDLSTGTVTLSEDLSAGLGADDWFTIRPSATLASVFGADNSAGLDEGAGGPGGADQIYLPVQGGGFLKYYYYNDPFFGATGWKDIETGVTVDPHQVAIFYPDGLLINGGGVANNSFAVAGTLKLSQTNYTLTSGFNYLSSVFPTGSTLASMFGVDNSAGLNHGNGGTGGADQVWLPDGLGGFERYYYDHFAVPTFIEAWVMYSSGGLPQIVDPSSVDFDAASGFIILKSGGNNGLIPAAPPSFYNSL